MMSMLKENTTLRYLDLQDNLFSPASKQALRELVADREYMTLVI